MSARYVLAPQAARDLVEIWQYIRKQSGVRMADHVESTIKEKFIFLSGSPGAGHIRSNLTAEAVKFFRFILTLSSTGRKRIRCRWFRFSTAAVILSEFSRIVCKFAQGRSVRALSLLAHPLPLFANRTLSETLVCHRFSARNPFPNATASLLYSRTSRSPFPKANASG